jgi:hypothetical protein
MELKVKELQHKVPESVLRIKVLVHVLEPTHVPENEDLPHLEPV